MNTRMIGITAYVMVALVVAAGCCGRTVIEREVPASSTTVVR